MHSLAQPVTIKRSRIFSFDLLQAGLPVRAASSAHHRADARLMLPWLPWCWWWRLPLQRPWWRVPDEKSKGKRMYSQRTWCQKWKKNLQSKLAESQNMKSQRWKSKGGRNVFCQQVNAAKSEEIKDQHGKVKRKKVKVDKKSTCEKSTRKKSTCEKSTRKRLTCSKLIYRKVYL